ncbi:MAG: hypothetical protein ABEJ47_02125 [Halorhabdus sp.]
MSLPGTTDPSVYRGLRDVLQRQPEVTRVTYEPDSILKRFIRATIDPDRVTPPTGPEQPTLDVEWRFSDDEQWYRIHYADPNTGFNCGFHRDEDHPELGPVHFQYENPSTEASDYKSVSFEKTIPTEVLWLALEELFETRIPTLTE